LDTAVSYARALAPYRSRWYEEAGDPLDYDLQAKLAPHYPGPMATGRKPISVKIPQSHPLRGLRSDRDVLQLMSLSYGLVEYLRILEMLREQGVTECCNYLRWPSNVSHRCRLGWAERILPWNLPAFWWIRGHFCEDSYVRMLQNTGIALEAKSELSAS